MMSLDNVANSIIKFFSGFDSAGKNSRIDTMLEYEKLGEYLNGSRTENAPAYSELSEKDKDTLQETAGYLFVYEIPNKKTAVGAEIKFG